MKMNEAMQFFDVPDSDSRVLSAFLNEHWGILPSKVEPILNIVTRHNLDISAAIMESERKAAERIAIQSSVPGAESMKGTRKVLLYDQTAVIPVFDSLVRRADMFSSISGAMSMESILADYTVAMYSGKTTNALLDIDSPGGTVSFTEELASEIARISADTGKPVEAFSSGMMTSAAQWIASAAQYRTVTPNAMAGNIGVITSHVSRKAADEKAGMKRIYIVSSVSPRKPMDPDTEEGMKDTQALIDALGKNFVREMSINLGVPEETILKAQGRVTVGKESLKYGFADAVGTRHQVMSRLVNGKAKVVQSRVKASFSSNAESEAAKMEFPEKSDTIQNAQGEESMDQQNNNSAPDLTQVEQSAISGGILAKLGLVPLGQVEDLVNQKVTAALAATQAPALPAKPELSDREKKLIASAAEHFVSNSSAKITTEAGRTALRELYTAAQEHGFEGQVEAFVNSLNSAAFTQDKIAPAAAKNIVVATQELTEEEEDAANTAELSRMAKAAAGPLIGENK